MNSVKLSFNDRGRVTRSWGKADLEYHMAVNLKFVYCMLKEEKMQ
jgi:hypothetical protein